jgi:hypothetical protein
MGFALAFARAVPILRIFLFSPAIALAQARVVVPVAQTVLPDGDIRYSVPVRVGDSVAVDALLDTGSTGLRVMRGAMFRGSYTDTGFMSVSAFSAGDKLTGTVGTADLNIGGLATDGAVPFEIVDRESCASFRPNCGAAGVAAPEYGIGGDGIAGQGFQAILGVGLRDAQGAENPLEHLGAKQWIIDLPEPGQGGPGRLILNPDWQDLQGFAMFPLAAEGGGVWHDPGFADTLPACLNDTTNGQSVCGQAILDTGAPGIIAFADGAAGPLWSAGDQAAMVFGGLNLKFAVDATPGTGLLREPKEAGGMDLVAGIVPFFAFDVLYDAAGGRIGLRARQDAPDFTGAPVAGSSGSSVEVIQMNAPGVGAATPAGKMPVVITP